MKNKMERRGERKIVIDSKGTEKDISPAFPDKKGIIYDYKKTTEFLKEAQRLTSEFSIGQKEATWKPKLDYPDMPFALMLMSDMHYGSTGVNYDLLDQHLDLVENTPNFYLATNGDHVDAFNPVKHASGMMENPLPPQMQARVFLERLLELDRKNKMSVISHGNHDDFGSIAGQDFWNSFTTEFKAPIFTQGGLLNIATEGYTYKIVLNHTYWGRSKINITNAAKRLIEYEGANADVGWVGHTHESSFEVFTKGKKELIAVVSGTYKMNDPWASKVGISMSAGNPGITLMFWPKERKIEVFKDPESAANFINGQAYLKAKKK